MEEFDFEELIADMLDIDDKRRDEDDSYLPDKFYEKFEIHMEEAFQFAKALLVHTPQVEAGLSKKHFHAFVSKKAPVMLMKLEAKKF